MIEKLESGSEAEQGLARILRTWPKEFHAGKQQLRLAQQFFLQFYDKLDRQFRLENPTRFEELSVLLTRMLERHFKLKQFKPTGRFSVPPTWIEIVGSGGSTDQIEYVYHPGLQTQEGDLCIPAKVSQSVT